MNLEKIRADFPILHQKVHGKPLVYLDSAATTQKPRQVIEAISNYYENYNSNVHRGIHYLSNQATEMYEKARAGVASYLNAEAPEQIVFTRGTTESINLVANSWGGMNLRSGDVILLTEMEHHSNIVPWQLLAQRTGAVVAYAPIFADGTLNMEAYGRLLKQKRPRIVSMIHISNTLATKNPVAEMCAMAKEIGAVTMVDAAQSAGHCVVDVQAIGCDFLAFSGHKTCGPTGIGVLYGKRQLLDEMPPYQSGGEMISSVSYEESTFKPAPARFEAGTPNIAGAIGLSAALDYLDSIGLDAIAEHDAALAHYAYTQLKEISGINILGPAKDRTGLISFELKDVHAHDVVTLADQYGVALRGGHHCNQPLMKKLGLRSSARASFYLYTTQKEVDCLVDTVLRVQNYFSRGT